MASLKPGDTILLTDGTFSNMSLKITCKGTFDQKIIIKAQNPGKVILIGTSTLTMSGSHTTVANLVFKDGGVNKCISILGDNNRFTGCDVAFSIANVDFLVNIQNKNNRVDHCIFHDFNKLGVWVVVWRPTPDLNYAMIDHNIFRNRINTSGAANGLESIRIGTSDQSLSSSCTIIAENILENCNGEIEAISNKSCDNIYYKNTYSNCEGTLTLRHGNNCIVYKNKFLQNKKPNSGGIRVTGESHIIAGNYLKDINGNGTTRAGVSVNNGVVNTLINGYYQNKNTKIIGNVLVNNLDDFALGVQVKTECTLKPTDLQVKNNIVYKDISGSYANAEVFSSDSSVLGLITPTFDNNIFYAKTLGKTPVTTGYQLILPSNTLQVDESLYGVDEPIGPQWLVTEPEQSALPITIDTYYTQLKSQILSEISTLNPIAPIPITPSNITPSNITPSNITPSNITPSNITPSNITPSNITPSNITPSNITPLATIQDVINAVKYFKANPSADISLLKSIDSRLTEMINLKYRDVKTLTTVRTSLRAAMTKPLNAQDLYTKIITNLTPLI
jgi:hypothetical protein